MSRVQKHKLNKEIKKKLYIPLIITIVLMIFLLFVVDYRVNSSRWVNEVRIMRVDKAEDTKLKITALGYEFGEINYKYLKRDVIMARDRMIEYVLNVKDYTINVFNVKDN